MSDEKIPTDAKARADSAAQFMTPAVLQLPFSGTVVRDLPCSQP